MMSAIRRIKKDDEIGISWKVLCRACRQLC